MKRYLKDANYHQTFNNMCLKTCNQLFKRVVINRISTSVIFLFCCFVLNNNGVSQNIGINSTGATPNLSAGLDIDFTNKGVLLPRVALTSVADNTTIASPANSLLVYNTGASGLSPAGYYYNAGTPGTPIWTRFNTTTDCFTNWIVVTSTTTITIPAGVTRVKVCIWGGGGGGSQGYQGFTNDVGEGGAGGGGGGYCEWLGTVTPGASVVVTIGAGGAGSLVGSLANGASGGTSSFGVFASASGGAGGQYYINGGKGGASGVGSGGYLNTSLGNGGYFGYIRNTGAYQTQRGGDGGGGGGRGGSSHSAAGGGGGGGIGGGDGGELTTNGGNAAANSGAGGGGGSGWMTGFVNTTTSGGNGAAGKVVIFY